MQKTRLWIAGMIYPMANAVLFGSLLVLFLGLPGLRPVLEVMIPVAVVLAFVLAAPIAWVLAPRLRVRYWRHREEEAAHGFDQVVDEVVK